MLAFSGRVVPHEVALLVDTERQDVDILVTDFPRLVESSDISEGNVSSTTNSRPGTSNFALARSAVDWLILSPSGRRDRPQWRVYVKGRTAVYT